MGTTKSEFSVWLDKHFLMWQYNQGGRRPMAEFSKWIGVSPSLVAHWINGHRVPSKESARKLAEKLGVEVYDLLGMEKPDLDLEKINEVWPRLPQKIKTSVMKSINSATSDQ